MSDCVNGEAGPHIASTAIAIGAVIPKFIVAGNLTCITRCLRFLAVETLAGSVIGMFGSVTVHPTLSRPITTF